MGQCWLLTPPVKDELLPTRIQISQPVDWAVSVAKIHLWCYPDKCKNRKFGKDWENKYEVQENVRFYLHYTSGRRLRQCLGMLDQVVGMNLSFCCKHSGRNSMQICWGKPLVESNEDLACHWKRSEAVERMFWRNNGGPVFELVFLTVFFFFEVWFYLCHPTASSWSMSTSQPIDVL